MLRVGCSRVCTTTDIGALGRLGEVSERCVASLVQQGKRLQRTDPASSTPKQAHLATDTRPQAGRGQINCSVCRARLAWE